MKKSATDRVELESVYLLVHPGFTRAGWRWPKRQEALFDRTIAQARDLTTKEIMMVLLAQTKEEYQRMVVSHDRLVERMEEMEDVLGQRLFTEHAPDIVTASARTRRRTFLVLLSKIEGAGFSVDPKHTASYAFGEYYRDSVPLAAQAMNTAFGFPYRTLIDTSLTHLALKGQSASAHFFETHAKSLEQKFDRVVFGPLFKIREDET